MKKQELYFSKNFMVFSALVLSILGLSGCGSSTYHKTMKRDPQVVASPDKVSLMLAQAADKASNALESLAAVEQSRAPAVSVQPVHNAPPELQRAITVNWIGPADQLVKKLADRASYSFLVVGDRPPVPVVVNVDAENKPVIEVLRSTGLQLGVRGDVKVDSTRKMVELHYAPVTGLGS